MGKGIKDIWRCIQTPGKLLTSVLLNILALCVLSYAKKEIPMGKIDCHRNL